MTRAALFGAVMGLLLGGAVLVVLALQVSVVDMPGDGEALALPRVPQSDPSEPERAEPDSPAAAERLRGNPEPAPPPVDRVVSPAPGPEDTAPLDLARLTTAIGRTGPPEVPDAADSRAPERPARPGFSGDADLAARPNAIAEALAARPPTANAIRVFRPIQAASRPTAVAMVQPDLSAVARHRDPRAIPQSDAPQFPATVGLPAERPPEVRAATQLAGASGPLLAVPTGAPTAAMSLPTSQAAPMRSVRTPVGRGGASSAAPVVAPQAAAPQAAPARRAGVERTPMILWLLTGLPADAVAPDWAIAAGTPDAQGEAVAQGGAVALPPLDQPEALAGFTARLDGDGAALMLRRDLAWPAVLLAPVLNLPALQGMPVFYPAGVGPETVALLRRRDGRSMPVHTVLGTASGPSVDAVLARVAERARRDGLAVVQVPAEPAVLEAVSLWRDGPGAALGTARLHDLFGG